MYRKDSNINLLFPMLLVFLLMVPFIINFTAHALYSDKKFAPLVLLKLPADDSSITLPDQIYQHESFEVSLQLDTNELAKRINDLTAKSVPGSELQGIHGQVFPEMRAEIYSDAFLVSPTGPQDQVFSNYGLTHWSWSVTPKITKRHQLYVKLYLQTDSTAAEPQITADLAEVQIYVLESKSAWQKYGIWSVGGLLLFAGWWWHRRRRRYIDSDDSDD